MNKYIFKLTQCGFSPHEAYKTYYNFLKEYSLDDLISFIDHLEKDCVHSVGYHFVRMNDKEIKSVDKIFK